MGEPVLSITDGTNRVDFVSEGSGFHLVSWRPAKAPIKGGGMWRDSPLSEGRKLRDYRWANAVETWNFAHQGLAQDQIIARARLADQLLVKAVEYWATSWTEEPVWLEARGPEETNVRYAEVRGFRDPEDANPYAQPFFSNFVTRARTALSVVLERGQWQSRPPCGRDNLSEGDFEPQERADDAMTDSGAGGTIDTGHIQVTMGKDGAGDSWDGGFRFREVIIPAGARILSAYIEGVSYSTEVNDDCNLIIYGERDVNPALFTTYADFHGRERTIASIAWHQVSHWTAGTLYRTPDLTPIIQEIVDLAHWSSGNELVLFIQDLNSTTNTLRRYVSWDNLDYDPSVLHVVWIAEGDECFDCVPVGARQAYPNMEYEGPFVPTESADDKYVSLNLLLGFLVNTTILQFGGPDPSSDFTACGVRFRSVTVPQGATIAAAFVRYTSATAQAGNNTHATLEGEDDAHPAPFNDGGGDQGFTDYNTRARTTASVAWNNVIGWVAGTQYDTPDIATIAQEIVDLPGWASGNNMVIFCDDNSSAANAYRQPASWDNVDYTEPQLYIDWWDEDGFHRGQFGSCPGSFVASKHNEANITHIFLADNVGSDANFSANLVGRFGCGVCLKLFAGSVPDINDCTYFIIDSSLPDSGPFNNLVFNVGAAAAYEGLGANEGIIWEYRDAAGWSWAEIMTVQDNTHDDGNMTTIYQGPFNVPGRNIVCWEPESDWTVAAVNGITGWAIRARVIQTSGSISMPYQCDQEIYSVVWPYVEIGHPRRGVWLPEESADDAYINSTAATISVAGANLIAGRDGVPNAYALGVRFRSVGIPRSATILDARMGFQAAATDAVTVCDLVIYGEGSASPLPFSTHPDFINRMRIPLYIDWIPEAWVAGNYYWTPDISSVVQQIVNLREWSVGCDMALFAADTASSVGAHREASSWDNTDYRPPWLCVTWTEDPPGGDIPLRIRIRAENESGRRTAPTVNELTPNRAILGLRTLSRGTDFRAYLNARYQNPGGVTTTITGATGAWQANTMAADGWSARYNVAALGTEYFEWLLDPAINPHYYGQYRMFLRVHQITDTDFDVTPEVRLWTLGVPLVAQVGDPVSISSTSDWHVLDFGLVRLPPFAWRRMAIETVSVRFSLFNANAGAASELDVYDLILVPADEWLGDFPISILFVYYFDYLLEIDSLTYPKSTLPADARMREAQRPAGPWPYEIVAPHESRCTVPIFLQANAVQRLHFLFTEVTEFGFNVSLPPMAARVWIDGVQRYRSMRGTG